MDFLNSKEFYYKIALITVFVVFVEMVLGSYVKSIEAGLSCPDWPLCYGQLIPLNAKDFQPYTPYTMLDVWSEYIHRITATLVSFFLVFLAYLTYKHKDELSDENAPIGKNRLNIAILILVLLALQVILGGLTVIMDTNAYIVTSHLSVAALIFGTTIFLTTKISTRKQLAKQFCPSCGFSIGLDVMFCSNCGTSLAQNKNS